MKVLFLHQSFPGQFKNIARSLAGDPANDIRFICRSGTSVLSGVTTYEYAPTRDAARQTHHYVRDLERAVLNGQTVVRKMLDLAADGFRPDIVIGHNGWGETLFVKDVWPGVPLLSYFEFFYRAQGVDTDFDPEYPLRFDDRLRIRAKNATNLIGLEAADWGLTATHWQQSLYPQWARRRISVLHEGVDTAVVSPDPKASFRLPDGTRLTAGAKVVTYVARNLEPYRGIHSFIRALPKLLAGDAETVVVVVGGSEVSYGRAPPPGDTYLSQLMREVTVDWRRVWFLGQLPYEEYLSLLRVSAAHVYLTYPFVLSWSMLEAMSAGCLVIGSDTPPVREVIEHGSNGFLVDFFSPEELADRLLWVLERPERAKAQRRRARQTIVDRYDFDTRIRPRFLELIESLILSADRAPARASNAVVANGAR